MNQIRSQMCRATLLLLVANGCSAVSGDDGNGGDSALDSPQSVVGSSTSTSSWANYPVPKQTGNFTAEWDGQPNSTAVNAVTAFAAAKINNFTDACMLVRFNPNGTLDVRSGNAYRSDVSIKYSSGKKYHFRLVADMENKTYDVFVTPEGGAQAQLASGYSFRSEQAQAASVSDFGIIGGGATGKQTITNAQITASDTGDTSTPTANDMGNAPTPDMGGTTVATSGAKPGASNTGPTDPSKLAPSGSIKVTVDGTVVENVDVTGGIDIEASNVTIRNFRIAATSWYGINILSGTGAVIEDGEITGAVSTAALLYGGNFNASRLNLHDTGNDAVKPKSNVTMQGCWIHNLGTDPTSHADGVQMTGGSNDTFIGNNFDMPSGVTGFRSNSAFIIGTNNGPVANFTIAGNWMDGGNYTVYVLDDFNAGVTHVSITDNWFGRDYNYGIDDIKVSLSAWSNNRWMDTSATVSE